MNQFNHSSEPTVSHVPAGIAILIGIADFLGGEAIAKMAGVIKERQLNPSKLIPTYYAAREESEFRAVSRWIAPVSSCMAFSNCCVCRSTKDFEQVVVEAVVDDRFNHDV